MSHSQTVCWALVLVAGAMAGTDPALQPLSLREALQRAQANNPQGKAAQAAVEQAEGEVMTSRGRMLPDVSVSARATRIDEEIILDLDPIRTAMISLHSPPLGAIPAATLDASLPHFQSQVQDKLYYNATASVQWPIFTGGRVWAGYQASQQNVVARKAEQSGAQNAVALEAASRYFTLRLADELVALRSQTRENLASHVDNAKRLEAGGQIAMAERLRAEVALAEAQRELDDASRDRSLARIALASTLGSDTLLQTTTALRALPAPASLEAMQQRATQQHPGLRRLAAENQRTRLGVTAARGEWFPVVALFGKRELYTADLTLFEPTWAVGANLQWNLFQGGQTLGKQQSAKALQREVLFRTEKAQNDVNLLVEKRWRELEHASGRLQSLDKTGELAEESLRAQQKAFEAGVSTSLDVVDAQLALARLRVARLKAEYDADMALVGLLEAMGEVEKIADMLEVQS